ncbi:MAG TPA: endolytic transglycosylase MltG [Acidimicrobiales bacterium]|nr:endolytic transglycosylase MltG [Acidimicrobiales bacterium]
MTMDEPAYETMPDRGGGGRGRKLLLISVAVVVIGVMGAGAVAFWVDRQLNPAGEPGAAVNIEIPRGSSTQRIAGILEQKGVVDSARVFRLYVKAKGGGPFQAGAYSLRRNEDFNKLVAALVKGPRLTFQRFTVPEGLTVKQLAQRVGELPGRSAEKFLQVLESGQVRSRYQPAGSTNLEGLLLPETYNFEKKDDELAIVRRMVRSFDDAGAAAGIDSVTEGGLVDPYQAIVVASLVEREARVPDDRGMISRVIYNRLKKGMLLQVDATVIYALGRTGEKGLRVLNKDLEVESPYNTYKVKGLPPAPIASPGKAALQAAVTPTPGDWLYYVVVDADGRHAFATTLAEHNRNIALATSRGVR